MLRTYVQPATLLAFLLVRGLPSFRDLARSNEAFVARAMQHSVEGVKAASSAVRTFKCRVAAECRLSVE